MSGTWLLITLRFTRGLPAIHLVYFPEFLQEAAYFDSELRYRCATGEYVPTNAKALVAAGSIPREITNHNASFIHFMAQLLGLQRNKRCTISWGIAKNGIISNMADHEHAEWLEDEKKRKAAGKSRVKKTPPKKDDERPNGGGQMSEDNSSMWWYGN